MDKLTIAYSLIADHLRAIANPTIVELGMCDGYHTGLIRSWCSSKPNYHGFEPDPRNIGKIVGSGIQHVINFNAAAVGNVTGTVPFYLSTPEPNGCVGASSISEFTPVLTQSWSWLKCQETIQAQSWRLDDYCKEKNLDHIDFLWMDVQGAERLVFDGAPQMLPKTKLLWTEYDGGTLYKDSSTIKDVLARFPDWEVLIDAGGDVLLKNTKYAIA
jgi:FkbM family methyltransferase